MVGEVSALKDVTELVTDWCFSVDRNIKFIDRNIKFIYLLLVLNFILDFISLISSIL